MAVAVFLATVTALLFAAARRPADVRAQSDCAELGAAGRFNVLSLGDGRVENGSITGRFGAGGNVTVSMFDVGSALAANAARIDLIAGQDLTASNAEARNGSVTYGDVFTGAIGHPNGTLTQAPMPFDVGALYVALRASVQSWADVAPNGTVTLPVHDYDPVRLVGTDPDANIFRIDASDLQRTQAIEVKVPDGATALVNVMQSGYTSGFRPTNSMRLWDWDTNQFRQFSESAPTAALARARDHLVWSFPDATSVQIGPGMDWQGTVLAPSAVVVLAGNVQVHGPVIGQTVEQRPGSRVTWQPFDGCLPPPCPPVPTPTPTPTPNPTPTETPTVSPSPEPSPSPSPSPSPEPTVTPPPLPPTPITPSPPGDPDPPAPPTGGALGEQASRTVLQLCKKVAPKTTRTGRVVTYRIEIRNVGLAPARGVRVCDPVPNGLVIVRARHARIRGGRACWRISTLHHTKTYHLKARVTRATRGRIKNTARASAANASSVRNPTRLRVLPAQARGGGVTG